MKFLMATGVGIVMVGISIWLEVPPNISLTNQGVPPGVSYLWRNNLESKKKTAGNFVVTAAGLFAMDPFLDELSGQKLLVLDSMNLIPDSINAIETVGAAMYLPFRN